MSARLVLVLDFDGTLAQQDVGDALCDRFSPPRWRDIDQAYARGELSLDEAQRQMWALARVEPEAWAAAIAEVGALREGAGELLDFAAAHRAPLVLASGGFDLYISPLLGERLGGFEAVYCNRAWLEGGGVRVSFPHQARLGCPRCAVCKGRVVEAARAAHPEATIAFVGDGHSDLCAAGRADRLFAVRDQPLHRRAAGAGHPVQPFDSLLEVRDALAR